VCARTIMYQKRIYTHDLSSLLLLLLLFHILFGWQETNQHALEDDIPVIYLSAVKFSHNSDDLPYKFTQSGTALGEDAVPVIYQAAVVQIFTQSSSCSRCCFINFLVGRNRIRMHLLEDGAPGIYQAVAHKILTQQ
jgi:hypothetical protein